MSDLLCYTEFTDEQKEMQQVVRKFTQDEIIPKAAYHDQTGEVTNRDVMAPARIHFSQMSHVV